MRPTPVRVWLNALTSRLVIQRRVDSEDAIAAALQRLYSTRMSTYKCMSIASSFATRLPVLVYRHSAPITRFSSPAVALHSRAAAPCDSTYCVLCDWKRAQTRRLWTQERRVVATAAQAVEWQGLHSWRQSDTDNRRLWGDKGPTALVGNLLSFPAN